MIVKKRVRDDENASQAYSSFEVVAYDALAYNLPRFSAIVSAGLLSLFSVILFWPADNVNQIDTNVQIVTVAVAFIVAFTVFVYSFTAQESVRKRLFLLTSLLAASSYLTLGQFVYLDPYNTWVVAIVSISIVASGAIYFSKKYLTVQVLLGLASLYVPLTVIAITGEGTVNMWRVYILTSLFTSVLSYAVHKYVYTYATTIAVVTGEALESAEHDAMTGLLNREGLEKIYAMLSKDADTQIFTSPKKFVCRRGAQK